MDDGYANRPACGKQTSQIDVFAPAKDCGPQVFRTDRARLHMRLRHRNQVSTYRNSERPQGVSLGTRLCSHMLEARLVPPNELNLFVDKGLWRQSKFPGNRKAEFCPCR